MNLDSLSDLYKHMEWADCTVWATALASDDARADTKLREYFYHLHMVQHAFLRTWRGEPRDTPYPTFTAAQSLMTWARSYYDEANSYLKTIGEEHISRSMPLAWASMVEQRLGRKPESTTLGETLLQVVLHSVYHRGQINARLRALGPEPPLVDYIAWIWLGRPEAEWPPAGS